MGEDHVKRFAFYRYDCWLRIQMVGMSVSQEAVLVRLISSANQKRQSVKGLQTGGGRLGQRLQVRAVKLQIFAMVEFNPGIAMCRQA